MGNEENSRGGDGSMIEMFCDESNGIVQDMRKCMISAKNETVYGQSVVEEIFRGVHTLKANASMMLFDDIAELSKRLESLLYSFKGDEERNVTDVQRFSFVINSYLDYVDEQIDRVACGEVPEIYEAELLQRIEEYAEELKREIGEDDSSEYEENQPKHQFFYIPGKVEEKEETEEKEEEQEQEEYIALEYLENRQSEMIDPSIEGDDFHKTYMISEEEKEKVFRGVVWLQRVLNHIEYTQGDDGIGEVTKEDFGKLQELYEGLYSIKRHLTKTDFVPVAKKLEIVVDEMTEKLHKNAKLLVKGEETAVDFDVREKLSGVLIHMIRNAVDHGIEDMDGREIAGKSPMGLITLSFHTHDGHLVIIVKDDGKGLDKAAILRKAKARGLLEKPEEEYTSEEIFKLVLKSGLTTREEVGEFSGRGVGMNVIEHNIKDLGGKLKISSDEGLGTTFQIVL